MSNNNDMQEGFSILCARRGGYTVASCPNKHEYIEILFAGSLGDCLKYISDNIVKVATKPKEILPIWSNIDNEEEIPLAEQFRNRAKALRDHLEKYPDCADKNEILIKANKYEVAARNA